MEERKKNQQNSSHVGLDTIIIKECARKLSTWLYFYYTANH